MFLNDMARMVATVVIWAAITVIGIVLGIAAPDSLNWITLAVMLGIGWFATSEVWGTSKSGRSFQRAHEQPLEHEAVEKPKRMPEETNWTEALSDDELNALERALAARRAQMDEDQQIELRRQLAQQERQQRGE